MKSVITILLLLPLFAYPKGGLKYHVSAKDSLDIVSRAKTGWINMVKKTGNVDRASLLAQHYVMNQFIDSAFKQVKGAGLVMTDQVNIPYIFTDSSTFFQAMYFGYFDK